MSAHYYAVRYGDVLRMQKSESIEAACRKAFGVLSDQMTVWDLGTLKPQALQKYTYLVNNEKPGLRDDLCEACSNEMANRECAHGIICDDCDTAIHGQKNGACMMETARGR
jgi:hypothetical protein